MEPNLERLLDVFAKLGIFLQRPGVQLQLAIFVIVMGLSSALARITEPWIDRIEPQWLKDRFSSGQLGFNRLGVDLITYLTAVLLAIGGLTVASLVLTSQGFAAGLLDKLSLILWIVVAYRLCVTALYFFFNAKRVNKYHARLFRPFISLAVFFLILHNLTALQELAMVLVPTPFGVSFSLGALFASTVGLYFWIMTISAVSTIIYDILTRRKDIDAGALQGTLTLCRYILIGMGLLVILQQLQLDSTSVAAIVGGLSVGIGFGLREVLSNFISGVLLLFEQSLHPGDVIEVDDQMSVVEDLNIRATRVRLPNNVTKIIPNQTFFTSSFKSYDGAALIFASVSVVTSYDDTPTEVMQTLVELLKRNPDVIDNPGPSSSIAEFGPHGIKYSALFAVKNPLRIAVVKSEMNKLIWEAFKEKGFRMPLPQQDIYIRAHNLPPGNGAGLALNGTVNEEIASGGLSPDITGTVVQAG